MPFVLVHGRDSSVLDPVRGVGSTSTPFKHDDYVVSRNITTSTKPSTAVSKSVALTVGAMDVLLHIGRSASLCHGFSLVLLTVANFSVLVFAVRNLTVCFVREDDSDFSTYRRVAPAVDLGVRHANNFILPGTLRLQVLFQSSGTSCSGTQFSVVSRVAELLEERECNVFIGAGSS